jgi:hypothetical protein
VTRPVCESDNALSVSVQDENTGMMSPHPNGMLLHELSSGSSILHDYIFNFSHLKLVKFGLGN